MNPCKNPGYRNRQNCRLFDAIGMEAPYIQREPITTGDGDGGVLLIVIAVVVIAAVFK